MLALGLEDSFLTSWEDSGLDTLNQTVQKEALLPAPNVAGLKELDE